MFNRIVASIASRLPAEAKRNFVNTAFWHLQDAAYSRLKSAGFTPGSIIDVGAYDGRWSREVRRVFSAPILMIEAREAERSHLTVTCSEISNSRFVIALLSAHARSDVQFFINDTGSSMFAERSNVPKQEARLPTVTLDSLTTTLQPPIFLKLDVQGAELEILKGGSETLANSEVVQLEVALLNYNEGAPLAAEVIAFMDQRDFALFDIAGFIRPNDQHLVQIDVLFVRKSSKLRPSTFTY